jgi:hypothetical protein
MIFRRGFRPAVSRSGCRVGRRLPCRGCLGRGRDTRKDCVVGPTRIVRGCKVPRKNSDGTDWRTCKGSFVRWGCRGKSRLDIRGPSLKRCYVRRDCRCRSCLDRYARTGKVCLIGLGRIAGDCLIRYERQRSISIPSVESFRKICLGRSLKSCLCGDEFRSKGSPIRYACTREDCLVESCKSRQLVRVRLDRVWRIRRSIILWRFGETRKDPVLRGDCPHNSGVGRRTRALKSCLIRREFRRKRCLIRLGQMCKSCLRRGVLECKGCLGRRVLVRKSGVSRRRWSLKSHCLKLENDDRNCLLRHSCIRRGHVVALEGAREIWIRLASQLQITACTDRDNRRTAALCG